MSARSRLVGLVPGLVIGGGAGATLTSGSSGGSSLSWIREAIPDLGARLKAAIALPPSAAPAADSAALTASVAAIQTAVMSLERAMRMQALSPLRSALFFAVVAAGGLAVYRYGWDRIGWVTLNELRLGLGNVKASVEAMVGGLREELCSQLVGVRQQLDRTVVTVQATSADVIEVSLHPARRQYSLFPFHSAFHPPPPLSPLAGQVRHPRHGRIGIRHGGQTRVCRDCVAAVGRRS